MTLPFLPHFTGIPEDDIARIIEYLGNLNDAFSNSVINVVTVESPGVAITDGSVTESKLAANAVTTSKILDGTIVNADLANATLTGSKLVDDTVTFDKIEEVIANSLVGRGNTSGNLQEISVGKGLMIDSTTLITNESLYDSFTETGSVGTTETDIHTYTVPANTLNANGDKLTARFTGTVQGAATATKRLRVYFGGTAVYDSSAMAYTTNSDWYVETFLMRDSSTSVKCYTFIGSHGASGLLFTQYTRVTGLTLSNTQVFKITGQSGGTGSADNDILGKYATIRYEHAA